jgi:hypothetical protein
VRIYGITLELQFIVQFLNVNVILQTFRTVGHVDHELFRSSKIPDRFHEGFLPFLSVLTKTLIKRSETFGPERSNALERIVENVHVSKSEDQLRKKKLSQFLNGTTCKRMRISLG